MTTLLRALLPWHDSTGDTIQDERAEENRVKSILSKHNAETLADRALRAASAYQSGEVYPQ